MEGSKNFLLQGFSTVSVLKQDDGSSTEIVKGLDNVIYVRKRIQYTNLPYKELQKLECEYLPHVYFVAEDDHETIIIEEYVHGSNLQELLDNGTVFADEQVRNLGVQLCDALIALHRAEILHRDIKPSNIMQTSDGRIKLIDFGAARIASDGEQDTRLLGTPGFAPPEQFGFAATDKRSDVYALGKTLQVLADKNVSKQLAVVIAKCTELDPERRLASAEEVKKLLTEHKLGYKKYVAVILAAMVLGGGALLYQQRNAAPQKQTPRQQTQEQADDKKAAPKETANQDVEQQEQADDKKAASKEAASQNHEQQEQTSTPKQPAPPSADAIANKKAEQDEVSKPADVQTKAPVPAAEVQAADVGFYSWDWIFTDKIRGSYWREEEKAKAAGARFVQFLENTPYLVIVNKSDKELQDPYLVLDFQDFEVDGQNESYQAYGNRRDIVEFYEKSALGYKRVVLSLKGTVLPHDEHSQFFYGAIYQTGSQPKVNVTLMVGDKVLLQDVVTVKVQQEQ